MTLIVTAASRDLIVQSADIQLTPQPLGVSAHKVALVIRDKWTATVAFTGVGHVGQIDVSTWLAKRVFDQPRQSTLDDLIRELLTADTWLGKVQPVDQRRHTFVIAGFQGIQPFITMISNFEDLKGKRLLHPEPTLTVDTLRPARPVVIASGSGAASLSRPDRRRIERLLSIRTADRAADALAELNERISTSVPSVSAACHVAWTNSIGHGSTKHFGLPDDYESPQSKQLLEIMKSMGIEIRPAQNPDGTFKPVKLDNLSSMRVTQSKEFHEKNVQANPNQAEAWTNYGSFLQNRNQIPEAINAYERALASNPTYGNALGNLANVRWSEGDIEEAERLYRACLDAEPANHTHRRNLARLLARARHDVAGAIHLLKSFDGYASVPQLVEELATMDDQQSTT